MLNLAKNVAISALAASFIFVQPTYASTSKEEIVVIDNSKGDEYTQKISKRAEVDPEDAGVLINKYELNSQDKDYLLTSENENSLIISEDVLKSNDITKNNIKKLITEGNEIYIYGSALKATTLKILFELNKKTNSDDKGKVNPINDEQTLNIIGFKNGQINYTGSIILEDNKGNKLTPTADIYMQDILRHKEKSKLKPVSKTMTDSKNNNKVSILSYSTDTIVQSSYNNTTTFYANDAWNNPILRASLNTDWILKRNTANDSDLASPFADTNSPCRKYTSRSVCAIGLYLLWVIAMTMIK